MKKLYILILLCFLTGLAYGQKTVSCRVINTNGDSLKGRTVHLYADSSSTAPPFQPMQGVSDSLGYAYFTLPANLATGTKFYTQTLNCDSTTYVINTHIYSGNHMNSVLTVCITPPTNFSGYVYLGDASKRPKVKDAQVYLIAKCGGNVLMHIDSIETDTNGYFAIDTFPKLAAGCEVIMRAALKYSSSDFKKYLPSYHQSNTSYQLKWSGARDIPYSVAKNGIILILPEAMNPTGGPSVISGYAREESSTTRLPDKIMFITDMHDVTVDYTFTESNGYYKFGNLPFGTYKIFGDVWGKDNIDFIATVDADNVNILNLVFTENATEYKGHIATSVAGRNELVKTISVYPNPARDMLYIKGAESIEGPKHIVLTDITGGTVYNKTFEANAPVTVPVSSLPSGVYILKLNTGSETAVFRITK